MAKPVLTSPAEFPSKLHKSGGHDDPATIYGDHIAVGDTVNVRGTRGHRPTTWDGTIARDNGDGSFDVDDLTVDQVQQFRKVKDKDQDDAGGGGAEDVSVTVSNATDTSVPVTTPAVPTIP
jgi:hypothetical protein